VAVSGNLAVNGTTGMFANSQLDIATPFPIDSIRVHHLGQNYLAGTVYNLYVAYPDTIFISSRFADTVLCPGDSIKLPFTVISKLAPANKFSLQLSDASGSFAAPVTIGTLVQDTSGVMKGIIPANTPAGTGYLVRVVSSDPVKSSFNPKKITIKPKPYLLAGSNSPVCEGDTIKFAVTTPTDSFSWTGPMAFNSTKKEPFITAATTDLSGDYILTVRDNECYAIDTISITVKPLPPTPVINHTLACLDMPMTIRTDDVGHATFLWEGPNQLTSTSVEFTIDSFSSTHSGTYSVRVTVDGCSSISDADILVKPAPDYVASSNSPVCEGGELRLFITEIPGASYNWTGPGLNSAIQNPSVFPATLKYRGDYQVTVIVDGCHYPSTKVNVHVGNTNCISLYPSPNNGNFALTGILPGDKVVLMEIYNAIGQTVFSESISIEKNEINTTVNLTASPGVYMLKLKGTGESRVLRFVIDR
jgi:hypothetical protein